MARLFFYLPIVLATIQWIALSATADEKQNPTKEQLDFFESEVRPLLAKNCHTCHGPNKQKGKLRLDSLSTILVGGESGPTIIPGKSSESLLIEAVHFNAAIVVATASGPVVPNATAGVGDIDTIPVRLVREHAPPRLG